MSGRIAQFGRALAGDVSRRLFEQFCACVEEAARTGRLTDRSAEAPGVLPLLLAALAHRLGRLIRRFSPRPQLRP